MKFVQVLFMEIYFKLLFSENLLVNEQHSTEKEVYELSVRGTNPRYGKRILFKLIKRERKKSNFYKAGIYYWRWIIEIVK